MHNGNGDRKTLMKRSSVYKLNPFIDERGLLRVGGSLRKSNLHFTDFHPILLSKDSCITRLIVEWCHQKTAHGGRGFTINEIRNNRFWVVRCNTVVWSLIGKCVKCRLLRGKLREQKMADLPTDRTIDEPSFTNSGVNMFGPFLIKKGGKELKRYGTLFTCLSNRAVHIEFTCSLETDPFIQALRRFVARRGNIRVLRSDNGSNFVGAQKELERHTIKWIIRRLNSSFRTLVQITLLGTETPQHRAIWGGRGGVFGKDKFGGHVQY